MKTLRISDDVHRKMTATVGTLMAQTGKMQTYQDGIEELLKQSVTLPPKLNVSSCCGGKPKSFFDLMMHQLRGLTGQNQTFISVAPNRLRVTISPICPYYLCGFHCIRCDCTLPSAHLIWLGASLILYLGL